MDENPNIDPRVILAAERTLLAWIRTGLALMGFGFVVARFGVSLGPARDFIDELRAHARTEDRLLYQWGDARLDEPERKSVIAALSTERRALAKKPAA